MILKDTKKSIFDSRWSLHLQEAKMERKGDLKFSYQEDDFIQSKDGRLLRVLAEYQYPNLQFEKLGVKNLIVFFGSARALNQEQTQNLIKSSPDDPLLKLSKYYDSTEKLAAKIGSWTLEDSSRNVYAICTGGGPGIMTAANKGAYEVGAKSVGLNIDLPFENIENPFITQGLNFNFKYFFLRKFMFAYRSEALIIMPGGFGTLDELFEILTLIQTEKINRKFPIVMFGSEFWNSLINTEVYKEYGVIGNSDLDHILVTDSIDEAYKHVIKGLTKNAT